jgi:hypothetical protein
MDKSVYEDATCSPQVRQTIASRVARLLAARHIFTTKKMPETNKIYFIHNEVGRQAAV